MPSFHLTFSKYAFISCSFWLSPFSPISWPVILWLRVPTFSTFVFCALLCQIRRAPKTTGHICCMITTSTHRCVLYIPQEMLDTHLIDKKSKQVLKDKEVFSPPPLPRHQFLWGHVQRFYFLPYWSPKKLIDFSCTSLYPTRCKQIEFCCRRSCGKIIRS